MQWSRTLACVVAASFVLGAGPALGSAEDPPIEPEPPVAEPLEQPILVVAPRVVGTPRKGERLICRTGDWLNSPTGVAVQWFSGPALAELGTTPTYVVAGADVGHAVSCLVTVWNDAGSATASSEAVRVRRIAVSVEHRTRRVQTGPILRFAGRVRTERPERAGAVDVLRKGARVARGVITSGGGFRLDVSA